MSTYLQLAQQVREECGIAGSGPAAVTGQTGEALRIVNLVKRAWDEIQEMHPDWRWMRADYSFTTTANDGSYTSSQAGISTRFGMWDKTYCTVYLTATGTNDQTEIGYLDYEDFRCRYLTGPQSNTRPLHFTVGDANELLLGPAPDSTLYTVAGKYYKSPQALAADSDTPELPEQHSVIAYRAMMKYAFYESAPEVLAYAGANYRRALSSLRAKYLPAISFAEPLV